MVPIILVIFKGINTGSIVHITLIFTGFMVPIDGFLFYTKRIVLIIIEALKALVIVSLTGVGLLFGTWEEEKIYLWYPIFLQFKMHQTITSRINAAANENFLIFILARGIYSPNNLNQKKKKAKVWQKYTWHKSWWHTFALTSHGICVLLS